MNPIEIRAAAFLLVAALLSGSGWLILHEKGQIDAQQCVIATQAAVSKSAAAASAVESAWKEQANADAAQSAARLQNITAARDAALASLRNRAPRRVNVPGPAASACDGGTGAGLSGPDAGFLVGESARANGLREALAACYAWIKNVKGAK